jgi:hypothetical protein
MSAPQEKPKPIPNRVQHYREKILALSKTEFARMCDLSDKTIQRIELQQRGFRKTTYYRIYNVMKTELAKNGHGDLALNDLYPGVDLD